MENKQKDILGNIPEIGDLIIFNPPEYKGISIFECIGFKQPSGLPMIIQYKDNWMSYSMKKDIKDKGYYTPKTGFVCIKK